MPSSSHATPISAQPSAARHSLRAKLTLLVIGVILITAIAVGWIGYEFARRTLRDQIEQRLRVVASDRQTMLLAYVAQQRERIGLVASRTQLRRLTEQLQQTDEDKATELRSRASRILVDAKVSTAGFLDIHVFDPTGKLLASTATDVGELPIADTPEFQRGKTARHLGIPVQEGERFVAWLTAPAYNDQQEVIGVMVVKLDVTPLKSLLADPTGLGETGEVLVGYADDDTIHYLFPTRTGDVSAVRQSKVSAMAQAIAGRDDFTQTIDYRNEVVFAVYEPVAYQDADFRAFGIVAKFDVDETLAPVTRLRNLLLLLNAALLLIGTLIATIVARRITRPLFNLTKQANAMAAGDTTSTVSVESQDEIGSLAAAFNQMATKVRQSHETLEQRVEKRTSELAAAQAELARQAERTRRVIDSAVDAFVAMNSEGEIVDWNPAAEQTFGWSRDEAMGRHVVDLLIPESLRESHLEGIQRYIETGEGPILGKAIEVPALHRDGYEFPIELSINPLRIGEQLVFNAFIRNITERKQAEADLHLAKEAAEEASRAKSDFLANMSHEIRTPMNAIMGMTELTLDTEIDNTQRDYLQTALDSAEHLLTIINEILDFSKIEAGRVELEMTPFSLRETIGDTMKVLAYRAHRKGLEVAYHIAPDVPDGIVSDVARLRQIIINLVGNAIKFTERGEVLVDVCAQPSVVGGPMQLQFTVRDTGIGIPADRVDSVFESFTQADTSTTRRFGGTGLGLTICKQLIELMNGRIWVESQFGQGSAFHFTLPVSVADDASVMQPVEQADIAGLRVLVVDDNATNCTILEEMLRVWGLDPTIAESGQQALVQVEQSHAQGRPFRLILSDLHMPEMDGLEMIARIRAMKAVTQPTIIMLTSGERAGDAQRRNQLDVAACLMKPIKQSELLEEVLARLGSHQVVRLVDKHHATDELPQMPPLKILVAEDGVANRKLLAALLKKWGHDVAFAVNGLLAVERFATESFDLILMDVEMPELDGLQATGRIRQLESERGGSPLHNKAVPIVALTAHALAGDQQRCLDAGMNGYVGKPIRAATLLEAMANAIQPEPTEQSSTEGVAATADEAGEIDLDAARDALGGDEELLQIVARGFLEESPALMDDIRAAVAANDSENLRLAAHALKGTIRYYGETTAYQLAYQLETAAANGVTDDQETVDRLEKEVVRLRKALLPLVAET